MTKDGKALARRAVASGALDLQSFEEKLLEQIDDLGLPTDKVFVPVRHRVSVLSGAELALEPLSGEQRKNSVYLSKFLAAVAAGLFDAALNYLWDETVGELRRRVSDYDLAYFFDVAVGPSSEKRTKLTTFDDLSKIEDQEMILAANRMGLLSDTGKQQLDLVRYMRNHASAAHPNQVELRALQLLGYLEACIAEVMTLKPDKLVIEIKRLLANIKTTRVDPADVSVMSSTFDDLGLEQADNLGNGLFGIYTRVATDNQTRDNVRLILPELWSYLGEDAKKQLGVKAARYRINHQTNEAKLARELLETVDATSYLPDELRVPEIDAALDNLLAVHHGWSNFSAEGPAARQLAGLLGDPVRTPGDIRKKYVKTIVYVFLTNGNGVSWSGDAEYVELIEAFTPAEARIALSMFTDRDVANKLHQSLSQEKFKELLGLIDSKIVSRPRRDLLAALQALPESDLSSAHRNRKIRELATVATKATKATA